MKRLSAFRCIFRTAMLLLCSQPSSLLAKPPTPVVVGAFPNEVRQQFTTVDGQSLDGIRSTAVDSAGRVVVGTTTGLYWLDGTTWIRHDAIEGDVAALSQQDDHLLAISGTGVFRIDGARATLIARIPRDLIPAGSITSLASSDAIWIGTTRGLFRLIDQQVTFVEDLFPSSVSNKAVYQIATAKDRRVALATQAGLFVLQQDGRPPGWQRILPRDGNQSWAPIEVRGVAFDQDDRLWFASPQGVGWHTKKGWKLLTGNEGLPFNDFTTMAAGERGVVWFGTTQGAIRFDGSYWTYRNGRRWMPEGPIRSISVTREGHAWFGTDAGIELLERRSITLAEKAKYFEDEIDRYHRRTPFGFVMYVGLKSPGQKETAQQRDNDNDGLWTSMYGAGECFAYAATKSSLAKQRATRAFEAIAFLSEVTQGGLHPAPPGFPARSILPTSGEDPNAVRSTPDKDRRRQTEVDPLWKIMNPRWPTSADGKWYWKSDTSSDELDGHFFLYACYYDLVAETEQEKQAVRDVVRRITDHLIDHDFNLVDHDGKPTRWAYFGPDRLNGPISWARGLNSLSILSYLKTAQHIVGDERYAQAYRMLIDEHQYATNTMWPKTHNGPGSGNQSDDEMAFMCYYNLLKYEQDPELRAVYLFSLLRYWRLEEPESCPLFNFIYAASFRADELNRRYGVDRFEVPQSCLADAVDTLQRIPLDRMRWGFKNSHRIDVVPLGHRAWGGVKRGHLRNGKVLPVDERDVVHWNFNPWTLDDAGGASEMSDGTAFLLPYYMGLHHGFIVESTE